MTIKVPQIRTIWLWVFAFCLFYSCSPSHTESDSETEWMDNAVKSERLRILTPEESGIDFTLTTQEDEQINYFKYIYLYNNGGVSVGDLNNDGLEDLIFTTYRQGCRVYQNLGELKFKDVTQAWGLNTGPYWLTGATIADIDSDGDQDVYFCTSGPYSDEKALRDLVYLNQGNQRFIESGQSLGLNHSGNSQSALIADFDRDDDIDIIVLGHRIDFKRSNQVVTDPRFVPYENETDRFYENNGDGTFSDKTAEAGLRNKGFSLAAGLGDFDNNGGTDMYVANDFTDPDRLYMNNGQARFRQELKKHMAHCSYFSMGLDIADINNDGACDILVVDMTPSSHQLSKENMASMRPDQMQRMLDIGYPFQSMTNSLQLARGNGTFSEVAHVAGVDRTDWSWSPLIFDLDNDGFKDLFISNGIKRDVTNSDFKAWQDSIAKAGLLSTIHYTQALNQIPSHVAMNQVFRNNGDLTFSSAEQEWNYQHAAVSTGAAYADLDNDGDIDLVTIDHDQPARVVENRSVQMDGPSFVQFHLKGTKNNPDAIGAAVKLFTKSGMQYAERFTVRGFQSASSPVIHFGLGNEQVDSLVVKWPNGMQSIHYGIASNTRTTLNISEAIPTQGTTAMPATLVQETTLNLPAHKENAFNDFGSEILLPHKQSQHGPALAIADVDGDDISDLFQGGSLIQPPTLYLGKADGSFEEHPHQPWTNIKSEFIGAEFVDLNQDGKVDLYLAAGSTELPVNGEVYQDRIYLNEGNGRFGYAASALPTVNASTQVIVPFDIDQDGDLDLFVGGRNVPGNYGRSPKSYMLENDGNARFTDISDEALPSRELGMITDAVAQDMNNDGLIDLLVAGEWTTIKILKNEGESLIANHDLPAPDQALIGWWNRLHVCDIDGDNDLDIIAGNLGLNNKFHPSVDKPLKLYLGDMDQSGNDDIVLAKTSDRGEFPVRGRECSSEQMPFIAQRFPSFKAFASADIQTLYGGALGNSLELKATEFRSMLFEADNGRFIAKPLPNACQLSPVTGVVCTDINGDGHLDLLTAGNRFGSEVETTPYDAGYGQILLGNGSTEFKPIKLTQSGFFTDGNVKDIKQDGDFIYVANNNDKVQRFRINRP